MTDPRFISKHGLNDNKIETWRSLHKERDFDRTMNYKIEHGVKSLIEGDFDLTWLSFEKWAVPTR